MARGTGANGRFTRGTARGATPAAASPPSSSQGRSLSPAEQIRVAAAYESGMSIEQLARAFAVRKERIRVAVVGQGGTLRGRGRLHAPPLDPETVAELVREYRDEHLSTDEIARRHGISPLRVRRTVAEAGIEPRRYVLNTPTQLDAEQRAAIAAAYEAGATMDELKAQHRCARERIREAIVEHGVLIRPGGRAGRQIRAEIRKTAPGATTPSA